MHRLAIPAIALLAVTVAGCAEDPFIDTTPAVLANLKPGSMFSVCYAPGTPREQLDALANQACGEAELAAEWQRDDRFRCRAAAVHRAWYSCTGAGASATPQ